MEQYRRAYNHARPHSSLQYHTSLRSLIAVPDLARSDPYGTANRHPWLSHNPGPKNGGRHTREALRQGVLATSRCENQHDVIAVNFLQYFDQVERSELIHGRLETKVRGSERAHDGVLGHGLPIGFGDTSEHRASKYERLRQHASARSLSAIR
jgi:hypothetical protein